MGNCLIWCVKKNGGQRKTTRTCVGTAVVLWRRERVEKGGCSRSLFLCLTWLLFFSFSEEYSLLRSFNGVHEVLWCLMTVVVAAAAT